MHLVFLDMMDWDYDVTTPWVRPLGGSQSALCYLAIELARRGHRVSLLNGTRQPRTIYGVACHTLSDATLLTVTAGADAVIVLNGPAEMCLPLRPQLAAETLLILWTQHAPDQPAMRQLARPEVRASWSKVVCVSGWHRRVMQETYRLEPERLAVQANAVGPAFEKLFAAGQELAAVKAPRPILAYTSTPFRGLDVLLEVFPRFRQEFPAAELRVYSSMRVYMQEAAQDEYRPLYERCQSTPGVVYVGSVPQPRLVEELRTVPILAYPSTFAETSCIAVLEALAAGLQVVTSDLGALGETSRAFADLVAPADGPADAAAFAERYLDRLMASARRQQADPTAFAAGRWEQVCAVNEQATWSVRARQWEEAVAAWKATAVQPVTMTMEGALKLANDHLVAGRLTQGATVCRLVLSHDPQRAEAHRLLGLIAVAASQPDVAATCIEQAIALQPDYGAYYDNLCAIRYMQDRYADARQAGEQAVRLSPELAEAHYNLARAQDSLGELPEALQGYRRALQLQPKLYEAAGNLASLLVRLGLTEEALPACRYALSLQPKKVDALNSLGRALQDLGALAEAQQAYLQALAVKPDVVEVIVNLATTVESMGLLSEAEALNLRALEIKPDLVEAFSNLSLVLQGQGRHDESLALIRQALEKRPDFVEAQSNLLIGMQYHPAVTPAELLQAHVSWAEERTASRRGAQQPFANSADPERPLRLGFVSADLGEHPVGFFLVRFLEAIDRKSFSVHCYATRRRSGELCERIRAASTSYREASRQDKELAASIRADGIDLLFDLGGHTGNSRIGLFARKPAPIQLTWLGYVGTTGLAEMDYLIADRFHVPPGEEVFYREKVLRLPDGYLCYDPPDFVPAVSPLPAGDHGYVTFGSFNNPAKITSKVTALWAQVLRAVPGSRLVLQYRGWNDPPTGQRLRDAFAAAGVAPDRLTLLGWVVHAQLLPRYNQIDIALDTFPYSGGLTTCEAMWMGVPVVTWPGQTFAGRHSLSHLSNVGLTETIARSPEEYVEIAAGLARDLPRLARLRAELRPRMAASPLCDGPRFARNLEKALREVWRRWCAERR